MRIIQAYKGDYLQDSFKRLQLEASAWQWKKHNPGDYLVLYCPESDLKTGFKFQNGYLDTSPWDNIYIVPDNNSYILYDLVRYEVMSVQDEDFGWLDPDTLTFEKVPDLVSGEVDFIGYPNEGACVLYPNLQEEYFQKFFSQFDYKYTYRQVAVNMGFFKTTAELGVLIGKECKEALHSLIKRGVIFWDPLVLRLHHFCSQAVPVLVIDRFKKKYRDIGSFYPELDHPVVWHLVGGVTMPDGCILENFVRDRTKTVFWSKVLKRIIENRGFTWEEFVDFYLMHKNDKGSLV